MAEQPLHEYDDANVYRMYVRRRSRVSLELSRGSLREAFLRMYSEKAREEMGRRALFLYSDAQTVEYRPRFPEEGRAEVLDSNMARRLAPLKSRQYMPARWIEAARPNAADETHFRINLLLDAATQEAFHAGVRDGLDERKFGRKTLTVALIIPDNDIAETKELRVAASRDIRDALWAEDNADAVANPLVVAKNQMNRATNIDWSSRIQG